MTHTIHIEVTFKGSACLNCTYMEAAVLDLMPAYGDRLTYRRVDILSEEGKKRFLDLSCSLLGEAAVFKHYRLAPIPSLFMDGELLFDTIPSRDELEEAFVEKLNLQQPEKQAVETEE